MGELIRTTPIIRSCSPDYRFGNSDYGYTALEYKYQGYTGPGNFTGYTGAGNFTGYTGYTGYPGFEGVQGDEGGNIAFMIPMNTVKESVYLSASSILSKSN